MKMQVAFKKTYAMVYNFKDAIAIKISQVPHQDIRYLQFRAFSMPDFTEIWHGTLKLGYKSLQVLKLNLSSALDLYHTSIDSFLHHLKDSLRGFFHSHLYKESNLAKQISLQIHEVYYLKQLDKIYTKLGKIHTHHTPAFTLRPALMMVAKEDIPQPFQKTYQSLLKEHARDGN